MRKRSLKDRVRSTLDKEFFNLPIVFGNSVDLIKNGSLYTFKGNFGGRFMSTMADKIIPLKKMNSLFKKISNSEITIEAFFMLELHTIIKTMLEDDKIWYKINKKALANLMVKITTETWFRPDEMIEYTYSLDMDRVNRNIALKLKDYQFAMFKRYEYLKNKLGYQGMLLDVATGGGKTLMALALAEGVRADKVFIVTIKQNLQTTWVDALLDYDSSYYYFKDKVDPKDVYTVDDYSKGKPYNDAKYIIFNYEALDKLNGLLDKIKYNNPAIVIDEAHNFVSLKSNRREELIKLVEKTRSAHRFPLSGTAVKDSPLDMAIYIELLDPRANKDSIRIYREVYGSPNKLLKAIAPIRYGDLSIKVEKHELKLDPIEYITLDVAIPNPERYTLTNIKAEMVKYFDVRTKELYNNEDKNRKRFNDIISSVRKTSNLTNEIWEHYLRNHIEVRKLYDRNEMYLNPSLAKEVSSFEESAIIPRLNKNEKDEFKDLTVTLKYPVLKVRGEVLGRVVLQARINCHKEMAEKIDYSILSSTLNKSVIMSSYVPVCESARDNLVKQGFKPIEIYGNFTKDQDSRIRAFKNDPDIDPLVGTYKSISTAHHFTVADMILLLDTPFRTYILDQAIARAWRTGQKNQVKIIYTRLNIKEDNINSRNIDILKWAKSMVEEITGNDISYLDFDKGKSIENIDIESIDDILIDNEIQDEEEEMRRKTIKDRMNNSTIIDNDTGVITEPENDTLSPIDAEGFIDGIKRLFTRKQESKAKNIQVDCSSDILGTRVEDFTEKGSIRNIYYGLYNMIIDDVKNIKDIKATIEFMKTMISDLDKLYTKYTKKVPSRSLTSKEINIELFDKEWGFDNERDLLEDDMYRNEDTINYINGSIWLDDNGKELIPEPLIKELKKLNTTLHDKLVRVYDILESSIVVNKIDKEEYTEPTESNTVDSEGILSNIVDKVKSWFKKKEENKKKDVVVDCESELAYTTIKQLTDDIYGPWQMMYDIIIDDCDNDADIGGLVSNMEDKLKKLDKAIADGSKKVPNRKLKASEYDSELFDPKWGFKEERSYLKYAYECNESTIKYINDDIWVNDNEKEKVDPKNIKELHRLNKLIYNKILEATKIIEKGIKVNNVDVEEMSANNSARTRELRTTDEEGIKATLEKTFTWLKDITTSDKQKLKGLALKITPAAYNLYADTRDLCGEFLEKGISYLDDEDPTIPVHIDDVDTATTAINTLMKQNSKPVILGVDTTSYGETPFTYDSNKDLIKKMASTFEIKQATIISMGMILYKGKKISDGFKWYVDMANLGIKTYKDDKEIVKALTGFKSSIESAMKYLDSNITLVKVDNSKIDAEAIKSIIDAEEASTADDKELTEEEAVEIGKKAAAEHIKEEETPNTNAANTDTADGEAIMLPVAIAGGAYIGYKALEAYIQENYGKVRADKFVDYNSFDTNNNSNKDIMKLNNISADLMGIGDLVAKSEDHLLHITSENIRVADLEAFDVFKGLASAGLNKANKAIDRLKSMLKTNEQSYRELSDSDKINMEKEIGIPRGFKGNLLDASEDILKASVNISTLKSNLDTAIGEISTFINSESLRESSIFDSSFIKVIDKNSKELYTLNTKYLTNDKTDRVKLYELINNFNDLSIITTNLRNASRLINPSELIDIKTSLSMVDELIKAVVANQNKFSKVKMKELGLLVDHLISYVGGVATLVYLKNSLDIMLDDIKRVI